MTGTLRLGDRPLAFAEFGVPDGRPVIFHAAMPGSRLYGRQLEPAALELGFRVVALDRPGIGQSGFRPGRTYADTAGDVSALADHLELDRFDVVGAGEGVPHAVATACGCGPRVHGVALVNGAAPPEAAIEIDRRPPAQRVLRWAAGSPWANRAVMSLVAFGARRSPGFILKQMEGSGSESDRAIVSRSGVRELITTAAADAFAPGARGPAHEMSLVSGEWGLPLHQITARVEVWHDEDSTTASRAAMEWMAVAIPDCKVNLVPDLGQLWLFDHAGTVLRVLLEEKPQPG